MIKKTKKPSKSSLKKRCDELFSKKIRARGFCEKCGRQTNLQCAHVYPRTNMALRFEPLNALCMCYNCHLSWAHKNPLEFTEWFLGKFPERANYLRTARLEIKKMSIGDYQVLLEELQK